MLVKKIAIIHRSLIVRKGLSAVLEAYGRPATIVSRDILDSELEPLNKSVIFADVSLKDRMKEMFRNSETSRNIFAGIGQSSNSIKAVPPYKVIIDINDTREELFSKLDILFPSSSVTAAGGNILTARETEILILVAKGYRSSDIASRLYISRHTVITHRKNICGKLGIKTPSGLTLFALANNLI